MQTVAEQQTKDVESSLSEDDTEEEEPQIKENELKPRMADEVILMTCGKTRFGQPCIILALNPQKTRQGDYYDLANVSLHARYGPDPSFIHHERNCFFFKGARLEYDKPIIIQNSVVQKWYDESTTNEQFHIYLTTTRHRLQGWDSHAAATARFPVDLEIRKQQKHQELKRGLTLGFAVLLLLLWCTPPSGNSTTHAHRLNSTETLSFIYSPNDQFRAYEWKGIFKIEQLVPATGILNLWKPKDWNIVWKMPLYDTSTEAESISVYVGIDMQGRLTARQSYTIRETWSLERCDKLVHTASRCNYLELTNDGKLNVYDGLNRIVATINE